MQDSKNNIDRRTLIQLVSTGLLTISAHGENQTHCGADVKAAQAAGLPYQLQFFSSAEAEMIEHVMEKIIPADDHSPGAKQARVIEFCDFMLATGPEPARADWRTGTRLLTEELKTSSVDQWLKEIIRSEDNPQTVLELFFRSLKQMTIEGYYTSEIGIHEELRYQGNTYLRSFAGCDHPEHRNS